MFLSAGHSNTDPGAIGNGYKEADIAVEIRNIVSFYLTKMKIKHEVDGAGTVNVPLNYAIKTARGHKLAVEFHCNASDNSNASGCEVLCAKKDNAVAMKINQAISLVLGIRDRGVKAENSGQHSRLGFIQAGGIIVELFFISNAKDVAAYQEKKWLLGQAIAKVLAQEV